MSFFVLAAICCVVDQLSKYYIVKNIEIGERVFPLNYLFNITHIRNPGGAFSLLSNLSPSFTYPFFIVVSVLAVIFILIFSKSIIRHSISYKFSFGLILGGVLGNLIDRVRYKSVIDFIDIGINNLRWPTFNFADSFISIGVVIIILGSMVKKEK